MNDKHKYGVIALTAWNVFVVLLMAITSFIKDVPFGSVFNDQLSGIALPVFFIIWSLSWFGFGYTSRKKYLLEKSFYRKQARSLTEEQFNKAFKRHYISKNAKTISIALIVSIPWYILGHVKGEFGLKDWIIIAIMTTISLFAFALYKWIE